MDIRSEIQSRPGGRKRKLVVAVVTLVALACGVGVWRGRDSEQQRPQGSARPERVKRGDMTLVVLGYGRLKSEQERFLASPMAATVEEIFVRPGELVTPDTIILKLSNTEIESRVATARALLAQAEFDHKERAIEQLNELTANEVDLATLEAELGVSLLRWESNQAMFEKGHISAIEHEISKLELEKLKKVISLRRQQLEKLRKGHAEDLTARRHLASQFGVSLDVQLGLMESLKVKARMEGVMKSLSVVPGEAVEAGHRLAEIGSTHTLSAELFVPQRDANTVTIGQTATVDADGTSLVGRVQRVDPVVVDGRIRVELSLEPPLPPNVRPELGVQGKIEVGRLANTLYIRQPPGTVANSKREMLKLTAASGDAQRRMVRFGAVSDGYAQILEGASAGDALAPAERLAGSSPRASSP